MNTPPKGPDRKPPVAQSNQGPVAQITYTEPPSQDFVLPSKGAFYDGQVPGGIVKIRPMTIKEEKILATARLAKNQENLKMIFQNCIKMGIDPAELLIIDKVACMLWLRQASYGNEYGVKIKCQSCSHEFEHVVDMEKDFDVKFYDGKETEPFSVKLPKCGKNVKFRLPRWKDEEMLSRKSNNLSKIDDSLTDRLSTLVVDVEGLDKTFIREWLEGLLAYDASILKDALSKDMFGVETGLKLSCPNCSSGIEVDLPITENFFRVYKAT